MISILLCDFYKACHCAQYDPKITSLTSYYVPRMSRFSDITEIPVIGIQSFIKEYLIDHFDKNFFKRDIKDVKEEYDTIIEQTMGPNRNNWHYVESLWKLGYLPLEISALEEGIKCPINCPAIQITNTNPNFAWVVNAIESLMSNELWYQSCTAIAGMRYRNIVNKYYEMTSDHPENARHAISEFGFRGLPGLAAAQKASMGFLLSFDKTATIPSIEYIHKYYGDSRKDIGGGMASSEHSVMTSSYAIDEDEETLIERLLTEVYPDGNFAMVCDSYDYWNVVDNILPNFKEEILSRNGTLFVRGDCYDNQTEILTNEGWKLFKDLQDSDKVAQFNKDKTIEFIQPLAKIEKDFSGEMYQYTTDKTKRSVIVTPKHKMVVYDKKKDTILWTLATETNYYQNHDMLVAGYKLGEIDTLTDYDRLMIAFQADGRCRGINKTEQFERGYTLEFQFSKERKIKRLEDILNRLNIKYRKFQTPSQKLSNKHENWNDGVGFYINIPNKPFKTFKEWVNFSDKSFKWCQEFIDEISLWDGHNRADLQDYVEFDNANKDDVEIVQIAATLAGYKTTFSVKQDNRKTQFNDIYRVFIDKKSYMLGGSNIKKSTIQYDGKIYCVTVPSGMLVVRRNNQVFISGNSGDPINIITQTVFHLWETFGGITNSKGYKVLDSHIRAIYGDSITQQRAEKIYNTLEKAGFAADNVALGAGSFSMLCYENEDGTLSPYTRDSYSVAIKTSAGSYIRVTPYPDYNFRTRQEILIYKNPKTDTGHFKKSHKGWIGVYKADDGSLYYKDNLTYDTKKVYSDRDLLKPVFRDGKLLRNTTFNEIRQRFWNGKF